MESFRILACIAFLAVCAYAEQGKTPEQSGAVAQDIPVNPTLGQNMVPEEAGPARQKKQALYPLAYSAYPYYNGYSAGYGYAYPYAYSAYSYGAYDDGKYYPGKYEKPYLYRSYPAAGYYNSPYYYYY